MLYAFIFVSMFSRYLEYIPRYSTSTYQRHIREYQFFQKLHHLNNTRTTNHIVIDSYYKDWELELIQESARNMEIIDTDVTISFEKE